MTGRRGRPLPATVVVLLLLNLLPALLAGTGCATGGAPGGGEAQAADRRTPSAEARSAPTEATEQTLLDAARRAADLLAEGDFRALADLVHPERGVRFSPYAYVDPEVHQVLHPDDLRAAAAGDDPVRLWGHEDGTGHPIRLDLRTYVERRVADAPFLEEGRVTVDRRQGRGNTIDNAAEVYPDARIVEFHIPGTNPRYEGMDWKSLRLAFVRHQGAWRLVGVIHDEWTI